MSTREHRFKRRIGHRTERRAARCDQGRPTYVKINDVTWLIKQFLNLVFVFLPAALISL